MHLKRYRRTCAIALAALALADCRPYEISDADWPHYARDLAATKYSPLDRIDGENVAGLEIAWTWESADYRLDGKHSGAEVNPNFQSMPIKIGSRLYTSTNQALALDPVTGKELWLRPVRERAAGDGRRSGQPGRGLLERPRLLSSDFRYVRGRPREVPMPSGLPLLKPRYGRITAIDMNTGNHLWARANGPGPRDSPAIANLKLPWLGRTGRPAPLLIKTLLFLGEGSENALSVLPISGGKAFRAWNKRTGDVVWEIQLAAGTSGAPMTYLADGRQFIVVAIGDRHTRGRLVALALPRRPRT